MDGSSSPWTCHTACGPSELSPGSEQQVKIQANLRVTAGRHPDTLSETTKDRVTLHLLIQIRTRFVAELGAEAQRGPW